MTITIDQPLIAERLAALQQQRAERKDPDDLMLPPREMRAYTNETAKIDAKIAAIRTAQATLAEIGTDEADQKWRDFQTTARATLCTERLQIKSPIRDREIKARVDDLEFCLRLIDRGLGAARLPVVTLEPTRIGELMQQAGYVVSGPELRTPRGWQGSLPEVEQRIKDQARKRASAQAALGAALVDEAEMAKREAEHAAHRTTLETMHLRNSDDGTGLVAYTDDDEVLDLSAMTPQQRAAFEWMDAAHRRATS